jgi:hypothetical protein
MLGRKDFVDDRNRHLRDKLDIRSSSRLGQCGTFVKAGTVWAIAISIAMAF